MAGTPSKTPSDKAAPWIRGFVLGPWQTNTYIIADPATQACWIVDPSFGPDEVLEDIHEHKLKPVAILLTHAHIDHIAGIANVLKAFPGLPIWIHTAESNWPGNPMLNLSDASPTGPVSTPDPAKLLEHGEILQLGNQKWRVLHTPGHSPGGITLYNEPSATAIVGDTLFSGSIGRSDLPGGDYETLENSIRTHLYTLPDATTCLPGHGPATTIADEKRDNPFVPG